MQRGYRIVGVVLGSGGGGDTSQTSTTAVGENSSAESLVPREEKLLEFSGSELCIINEEEQVIKQIQRGRAVHNNQLPARRPETQGKGHQVIASLVVCMLALMFGNSIGWTSPVQSLLQSDSSPVGPLSEEEISWLASLTFIGGIVGTFVWSRLADSFGRKVAGYTVALPFALGWGLLAFTGNSYTLLVGRFINGFGSSGALIVAPLYIGEIAQDNIRGALGSFVTLAMNGGIVMSYVVGGCLPYDVFNYVLFCVPLVFIILFYFMPETPIYLWSKSKKRLAEQSLLWLRGGNLRCLQEETMEFSFRKKEDEVSYSALFNTKGKRKGMLIGFGLFTFQQFCGILAILSYTTFIFHESGSSMSPDRATVIVGVIQLFASFVSSVIVERTGRKILLLLSYFLMGVSLVSIGTYFYLENIGMDVARFSWVPVASLSVHVLTYSMGGGPLPFVVVSEILPNEIRGLASSVIVLVGTLLAFVSVKIFPYLLLYVQLYGCFWFFSFFCFAGFIFTLAIVPETKGVPLQNILTRLNGDTYTGV